MAEEDAETIGDVLSRTGALNKDDMTTEVESYGLEVDPSWTKAEIMDNFEEFLNRESPEVAPAAAPVSQEAPPPPQDEGDAALFVPQQQEAEPPPSSPPTLPSTSSVRITSSPGWGTTPTAKAP